ncbi:MAG: T9SS type A sorting domain-containing protein [Candidatus Eisenbacteria bacterium]|nr:T9SS type A sorting domain-containing protein [Candidatus Eisenbacteria bacterium]
MKVSHLILIALVLLLSTAAGSWAATRSIPITGGENQVTLLDASDDALHYRIQVGELTAMDVVTKQGPFTRLILPGFHSSQEEGAPELPMMNRLIDIPVGGHARIEVIRDDARMIDLAEFGVEHPLFPAQPSMPKNADPETWPFVYNQDSYAVARVARDLGAVVPIGRMRAADIGRLEIAPVEYFPGSNQIRVHENIELRVVFDDANIAADQDLKERLYSPFFEGVYKRLDGYRTPHTDHPDHVRDVITMVVVTPSSYLPYLQEFVDWKTQRGFNMIVGVMGTPEVGSTTTSIQAYIRGLYNNPAPGYQAPSFVLFVGDVEQVPSFSGSGITDRPYCAIDADVIPDIYYGRFPAATTTQLQNMLDKTMMYDKFTMPNPAYLGEVVMIAGADASYGPVYANGQINYGTSQYFNAAHGIFSHTHLYPQSQYDDALIVQEVSDGCAYVNYTAHGSETSWSDPTFTQANVRSLQNAGEYCLAVGNCCLAMSFDEPECFGETWLREANKGAIGYIGGSNSTYWNEDYYWGVGYRSSIVANPVYDANALGAYDGVFHDHGEAMDQWYVTNDAIVFCGNLAVVQSGSSRINYYWDIYGLLGDPSISTYMGVPAENPVVHPETIFATWSSITVEAVPNSYVGITKNGEIIAAGSVGASGTVDLPFVVSPLMPGTAQIVVMAQNREPYIENINVIPPAGAYLLVQDTYLTDGNADQIVNAGESLALSIQLRNAGISTALDVTAQLTSPSEFLTIDIDTRPFGNIEAGASEWGHGSYPMMISPLCPDQEQLVIPILISGSEDDSTRSVWNDDVRLVVQAPVLTVDNVWIDDSENGNGNGRLDPGESAHVGVILKNSGHYGMTNITGTINSNHPEVSIASSVAQLAELGYPASAALAPDFEIALSPDYAQPFLFLTLHIAADLGYDKTFDLTLPIGGFLATFESGADGWTHDNGGGTWIDQWHLSTQRNHSPGGGQSWKCGATDASSYGNLLNACLLSIPLDLTGEGELRFWMWMDAETSATYPGMAYDGGIIEMSLDGGAFTQITPEGGYTHSIRAGSTPGPFAAGTAVYSGQMDWRQVTVDLSGIIGSAVFRFRFGSDGADGNEGWYVDDVELWTGMAASDTRDEAPQVIRLSLSPSAPNPSRGETRIGFALPHDGAVSVEIFDATGRLVRSLLDEEMSAGEHAVVWDGRDGRGESAASGIYFYRLTTPEGTLRRSMVLSR